jgi:Na+/H+-dicarboxylate symporter
VALLLGLGAAWPLDAPPTWLRGGTQAAALFGVLVVFAVLLPGRMKLPGQIFVAMVGGTLAGWAATLLGAGDFVSDYLGIFGTLFVLLLKVVVVPLIFVAVLCGVAGVGDARKLGALGAKTIAYFLATSSLAVFTGLIIVNLFQPGAGRAALQDVVAEETVVETALNLGQRIQQDLLPALIQNPIMAGQSPIVVIFMALLIGAALASLEARGEPALRFFQAMDAAFVTIIRWVMILAPIGVFALMARVIAELGVGYVITLAKYCATVLLGLTVHFLVLTLVLCRVFGGVSPLRFLRGMIPAFELSFSTSSSAATLPVTIDCVSDRVGADRGIAGFVLPVGATINMDGTALYVSIASLFVAQVYGVDLSLGQQFMVFLTAVLVSIGTAGIPGASIGLITIVLTSVGLPPEGIGIVIGVDRLLDMSRTVVNVTGDAVGAVIISRSEGKLQHPGADAA